MARSDTDIRDELRSLFSFAHIHKWCAQLDERISAFVEGTEKRYRNRVRSIIEEEYADPSGSKEHLVLALLLTAKLGERSFITTERLFARLRGRLDLVDQDVLRMHLFHNRHPLPADVAYDIGSRPYLSFRRAISHGMKIRTVHSTFTPSEVALYLTMIMCRVDLNEQNRAMLSFLIYRIDTELPGNVIDGTLAYLRSLKTIIAEIESKGDTVLSGEFNYAAEPTIGEIVPSEVAERPVDRPAPRGDAADDGQTSTAPEASPPEARGGAPPRWEAADGPSESLSEADPSHRSDEKTAGGSVRDRREEGAPLTSVPASSPSGEPFSVPSAADIIVGERLTKSMGVRDGAADRLPTDLRPEEGPGDSGERLGTVEGRTEASVESGADAAAGTGQDPPGEETAADYTIHFNRNVSELLRIIEGLDRGDDDLRETATDTDVSADGSSEASQQAADTDKKSPASRRRGMHSGRKTAESEVVVEKRPVEKARRGSTPAAAKERDYAEGDTGPTTDDPSPDPEPAETVVESDIEFATPLSLTDDVPSADPIAGDAEGRESDGGERDGSRPEAAGPVFDPDKDTADGHRAEPKTVEEGETPRDPAVHAPGKRASDAAMDLADRASGRRRGASSRKGVPLLSIVAGAVALLAVLVFVVRGTRRDHRDALAPPTANGDIPIEAGGPLPVPRPEVEPLQGLRNPVASDGSESGRDEGGAIPADRGEDGPGGLVWTVEAGQTAWDLFRLASSVPIATVEGAPYTISRDVTWLRYILDVFAVNPQLDQFTVIYPGQRITLPDYR